MELVAIVLAASNIAALTLATVMARRARYWQSIVEGPDGSRERATDRPPQPCCDIRP